MNKLSLPVPELTGSNYLTWSLKMKAALKLKKLFEVIEGEIAAGANAVQIAAWNTKNDDAVGYIQLALSDDHALQFAEHSNAKELWESIKETFTGMQDDRKIDAGNELRNLKMRSNETANDYIARAKGLAIKCKSLGLDVNDRELVFYSVRGLNDKFKSVREILKTQREKRIEEVLEIIREEETLRNELPRTREDLPTTEVFYSKKNKKIRLCYICRKPNHIAKNCYHRKTTGGSDHQNNRSVGYGASKHRVNFTECETKGKSKFALNSSDDDDHEAAATDETRIWILDSGASTHMARDLFWFETLDGQITEIHQAGKFSNLCSQGIGNVKAKCKVDGKINLLDISDVNYVPDLRFNLLSVTSLMDKGCSILSKHNCLLVLSKKGETILKAMKRNNRFEVLLTPNSKVDCFLSVNSKDSQQIWHDRLCHLNPKYLIKMKNYIDVDVNSEFSCEACDIGKITRKNHPTVNVDQSSKILELLHVDLCGPIQIESLGKSKYFLTIVDDFSGMYFTAFLKRKNEACDVLSGFIIKYENQMNSKVCKIRSDCGLEFCNVEMSTFLGKRGIIHQKTVPYNSESNGKAERANRVLLDRARIILYESGLSLSFWAEAIAYATRISNVTPRSGKPKIPYEIWSGKKPNLNYLKKFGCVVYFHVPKVLRRKFDIPGKRGILLGYAFERRGYRIFDIANGKVIEERSVKFDESLKGSNFLRNNPSIEIWDTEALIEKGDYNIVDLGGESESIPEERVGNDSGNVRVNPTVGRPIGSTREVCEARDRERCEAIEQELLDRGVRRTERVRVQKGANLMYNAIPNSYEEVKLSPNRQEWENAMEVEINSLKDHNVWEVCKKPGNVKLIKSKWVYALKEKEGRQTFKARLVAAGFNQIKNVDYSESYSPVMNIDSFRLLVALAAKMDLNFRLFDVTTAYLNSEISEDVFLTAPPGYENEVGEGNVCKLKRSIYGLPQSGRNWYLKLKSELEEIGFRETASDNCVFVHNKDSEFVIMCVYVDDIATFSNSSELSEELISKLKSKFKIKETTSSNMFLNLEITKFENGIGLSQVQYIKRLIAKYNLSECKIASTPIVKGEDHSFPLGENLIDERKYKEIIGELLYLANRTRPDIAFVTSYLSQFSQRPEQRHLTIAKRVIKYLNGSKDKILFYSNKFGTLNASADASWGNAENGKSFLGGLLQLGDALITWKCNKQKSVTLSTCETELFAIASVVKDVLWIKNLLIELDCQKFFVEPINVKSDSQSAINWTNTAQSSKRTRHVSLNLHFVKDLIKSGCIKLIYVCSDQMSADFLTKAVSVDKLRFSMNCVCLM